MKLPELDDYDWNRVPEPDPLFEMAQIEKAFAVREAKQVGRRKVERGIVERRRALDSVVTGFEAVSPEQLIAASVGANEQEKWQAKIEIQKRVERVRAVFLAVQYLTSGNEAVKKRAFEGLTALCWAAKGALWLPPESAGNPCLPNKLASIDESYKLRYVRTWKFIQCELLERLEPLRGNGEAVILTAALSGKFRYLPRQIKYRIIDRIRRWYRYDGDIPADGSGDAKSQHEGAQCTAGEMRTWFERAKGGLSGALGQPSIDVISVLVSLYPDGFGRTLSEAKGRTTEAIAKRRGVSVQQARADKRSALDRIGRAYLDSVDAWQINELKRISRLGSHPWYW
jgi:cell division protein FtsB